MHDPKTDNEVQRFEKEVQQKMGELEFSPSAAVWGKIELAVRKEKRRRVPVFWLFFLPAFLLMGAAGIYFIGGHSGTTRTAKNNPAASSVLTPSGIPGSVADQRASDQPATNRPATTSSNAVPSTTTPAPEPGASQPTTSGTANTEPGATPSLAARSASATSGTTTSPSHTTPPSLTGPAAVADHNTQLAATRPAGRGAASHMPASRPHRTATPSSATSVTEKGQPDQVEERITNATEVPKAQGVIYTTEIPKATGEEALIQPAKIDFHPVSGNYTPKVSAAPLTMAAAKGMIPKTQLNPKRPWEAGFTGGIGISSLHQALFKRSPSSLNDSRNFAAPAPVTGPVSGGSAAQNYTSKIQSDLAFWAGIFVQKTILKNLSVSVGLNLHYYSTKVYTGDKITNTTTPSYNYSSYLLSSAAAPGPGQTYPYYTTGDKQVFINRYYFLEIPGSIQWQISHSRVMPLFWEGGFSLSYLMSSNALYYNTHAGVFYKDGDVTNKTQFNLSTALMVGIPFKGVNLQVGPQVQYGLTSLLNTGTGGQHFFYGGIKLVVFPGKAHKGGKHRFESRRSID